ncbi:nuclear transport factor 2 family protein [Mucilaginibacter auburnensis]|nr:nuclear transport factor 2 family protein [Mucilaginibacter auburnensis]
MMHTDNKSILEKANAAVSAGDNEGYLAYCTEDTLWNFMGDQILEGKEAVRAYMKQTYIEPKFSTECMIAEGDFVTAIGHISLKDAEGHMTDYAYCDVWRFKDGKMAELKAYVVKI